MQAIVLLSGGQDSATCLAIAADQADTVHCICFDYGQRHRIEMECSQALATLAGASFQVVDVTFLGALTSSAMIHSEVPITDLDNGWPSTFVPGRNALFLTIAGTIAYERGAGVIYTGVCQTDYSGYPDCREAFIQSQEQTLQLALDAHILIKAPLMHLTKAQTVLAMQQYGHLAWYRHTHTCYNGQRPACGTCPSCVLRKKGFLDAGILDPLDYN
ncbi:MAG: 7-cyano-7-deazaguanine synthase QueC [Candidatus Marinamargulisbacteria bacterium]